MNFVILSLFSLFRSLISFTISFTLGYSSLSCILILFYLLLSYLHISYLHISTYCIYLEKKGVLLAEASMMAKHQDLANEEMRLKFEEMRLLQHKDKKTKTTLETEIAKVEAEEKVCTEFATSNEEYWQLGAEWDGTEIN